MYQSLPDPIWIEDRDQRLESNLFHICSLSTYPCLFSNPHIQYSLYPYPTNRDKQYSQYRHNAQIPSRLTLLQKSRDKPQFSSWIENKRLGILHCKFSQHRVGYSVAYNHRPTIVHFSPGEDGESCIGYDRLHCFSHILYRARLAPLGQTPPRTTICSDPFLLFATQCLGHWWYRILYLKFLEIFFHSIWGMDFESIGAKTGIGIGIGIGIQILEFFFISIFFLTVNCCPLLF